MKNSLTLLTFFICLIFAGTAYSQWQPDVRITNNTSSSYTTAHNNAWCVASSGSNVHLLWSDLRHGNYEIYYRQSTNGGVNWQPERRFTNNSGNSSDPSVSASGSSVHVVWFDNHQGNPEIYYRRSTNGGADWAAEIRLSNNMDNSYDPSVFSTGSLVHVVWMDQRDGNNEVYYIRSTNGGANWGSETRLTNDPTLSLEPSVSAAGNDVHISWCDGRSGYGHEIYYKRSTNGGASFGADTRLTNDPGITGNASISVSGVNVNLVWYDKRDGNNEIYYKRSQNGGTNWGPDVRLTNNSADSWCPSISASSSLLHVVWYDYRDGTNPEIYYKRSTNGGTSWETDVRLTNNISISNLATVSTSGTSVHVVWTEQRDGNPEIYYKRNPNGNFVGIENISSEIPNGFSLEQNYPNPFNPATNINFSIPKSGHVKLVVYDMMGKIAAELVNGNYSAGTYKVDFDASQLSTGTYFYKITAGEFSSVKKMTLVK